MNNDLRIRERNLFIFLLNVNLVSESQSKSGQTYDGIDRS